ncbi:hypothetical protein [Peribacillus butanolivorans]
MEDEYELTTFEREQLKVLHKLGQSTREMGAVLIAIIPLLLVI